MKEDLLKEFEDLEVVTVDPSGAPSITIADFKRIRKFLISALDRIQAETRAEDIAMIEEIRKEAHNGKDVYQLLASLIKYLTPPPHSGRRIKNMKLIYFFLGMMFILAVIDICGLIKQSLP